MKKTLFSSQFAVLIFLFMQGIVFKAKSQDATNLLAKTDQQFFIENKGQWPSEVLYLTKQNGLNAWITKTGVVYDFYQIEYKEEDSKDKILNSKMPHVKKEIAGSFGQVVKMSLQNVNTEIENRGEQKSQAYHNYMISNDQSKWASNVGLYKEATIRNIYNQIDERYYFDKGSIRYDYIVKPTGNVGDIQLNIEGANKTSINRKGELVFETRFGEVKQAQLYTYQIINGKKTTISSSFKQFENGSVGFEIGAYDKSKELVIDPVVYWSYLGGDINESNFWMDMTLKSGNVYVTGQTNSINFPVSLGSYNNNGLGLNAGIQSINTDVFVSELNATGTSLIFTTIIGGQSADVGNAIKVANNGNIYIGGYTTSNIIGSANYPTTTGTILTIPLGGSSEGFTTCLNPVGSLLYSTFIGSLDQDEVLGIDIDASNNIYIIGYTVDKNTFVPTATFTNGVTGDFDAFVIKCNSSLSASAYSMVFGDDQIDIPFALKLDALNNIYITGLSFSNSTQALANFTSTTNGFLNLTNVVNMDSYVAKIPATGNNFSYVSFIGHTNDEPRNLAINDNGEIYIVGRVGEVNYQGGVFPTINSSGGTFEQGYVARFSNTGLLLNTRLIGGSSTTELTIINDVAMDNNGDVNLIGTTSQFLQFTPTPSGICPFGVTNNGVSDAIYIKLSNDLATIKESTYIGGALNDEGVEIELDNSGVYLAGITTSANFPNISAVVPGYDQTLNSSPSSANSDAFVLKFNLAPTLTLNTTCLPSILTVTSPGATSYQLNTGTPQISNTFNIATAGTYTVTVTNAQSCTNTNIIVVAAQPTVTISSNPPNYNCLDVALSANALPLGNYTYQWNGPNGFNQTTQTTTAIGPSNSIPASGIYTVTVTSACGSTTATYFATAPPQNLQATAVLPSIMCGSQPVTLQAGITWPTYPYISPFNVTYTWTGGNLPVNGVAGATLSNGVNTLTVTPTATTIYTVTASVVNGCPTTTTVTVNVNLNNPFCCNIPLVNDANVLKLDNTNDNSIPANWITSYNPKTIINKRFYINGTFNVVNNITFKNCQFFFTANSKIVVNPNVILTLSDNAPTFPTLQSAPGCDMWDGIYADDNTEQIIINNSTISDMINGVVLKNGAKASIVGNSFTNNRIAMQLENMSSTPIIDIKNNTITAPSLIAPYLAQIGEHGIKITNCPNITIGGNSNEKNHFENLYNGIYISQQYSANVASTITTSYNTFKNITGGQTILPGYIQPWPPIAFNAQHRGNAIYGYNNNANYTSNLIHFGNNNSTINDFENCQRAAVVTSFTTDIENSYVDNGEAGFMHYTCENQVQIAINNHIDNVYLGILANGNSHGGFHYNVVNLLQAPSGTLPWFQYVSKGIDLNYYISNVNAGSVGSYMQVTNNTITTNANDFAWGVNFNNVSHTHANYNTITFNGGASNTTGLPTLRGMNIGIGNALNAHLDFKGNKFKGSYSASNLNTRSTGIFINRTTNANITCNEFNNLREGMNVVGNCQIDFIYNTSTGDGFKGNWFNTSSATTTQMSLGILFRNLASGGSLGNIGSAAADNHNTFGPASAYSFMTGGQNKKLFSMCATGSAPQPFIFTNPFVLNNNEVGSAPGICGYAVVSNVSSHYQYNCSNSSYVAVNGFPVAQALDIATNQMLYAEFNEVAEWMDEHALYEQLSEDETLMQNNAVLQQFYNDHQNDPTHYIVEENEHIRDLLLGMNGMTLADYQTALDNAETNNALIISTEQYEINERLINDIYITYLRTGAGSFTEAEWQTISDLATQCPYIGGSAVLKARNLYTLINPLVGFEDVTLCNSVGVYKNGNNTFNNDNNMLDSMSAVGALLVDANRLKIYPNPANSEINITYNTQVESQFIIYDITGRAIVETKLPAKNAKVSVDISRISNGVYTYKQSIGESVINTGKFVKSEN
jgi:hypothetical protein